jgi:hypothetical protein
MDFHSRNNTPEQTEKLKKIAKIVKFNHTTEDKKHGEYHITQIGVFTITHDTYNGYYYLKIGNVNLDLEDYLDKVCEAIDKEYKMPSSKMGQFEWNALLDYLYLSNKDFKITVDAFYRTL